VKAISLDPVALLTDLLEHYSPTGQEAEACNSLRMNMQALGFTTNIDGAGNVCGSRGDGPHEILLLGHIDTVPGYIEVLREQDTLYGRGSVDAKGPLACFVSAAAQVDLVPGWRVTVIGAVGEEGDSPGARYLCEHYPAPAMVVIGEPSGWNRVTLGYKGSQWLLYTLQRPLAHTAARAGSACEGAVEFWNGLLAAAQNHNQAYPRPFDQLTPTLRAMNSSSEAFQETAQVRIGLRVPLTLEPAQLTAILTSLAQEGQITIEDSIPPYRAAKNTALVRAFLAAIRAQGGEPGFTLKTGTSDMNLVGPLWQCPILAYGPGDSDLDHTPHEHVSLHEYQQAVTVLTAVLARVMQE
jgi:[amino group carrier protein]-lysine/ornithine hydrolase